MKITDLKRGMRCTTREGDIYTVDYILTDYDGWLIEFIGESEQGYCAIGGMLDDLTHEYDVADIMMVEDITTEGYRTIWERTEKKYYLCIPTVYTQTLGGRLDKFLNYHIVEDRYFFSNNSSSDKYQVAFTLEEIENLPEQDFIKGLEKLPI